MSKDLRDVFAGCAKFGKLRACLLAVILLAAVVGVLALRHKPMAKDRAQGPIPRQEPEPTASGGSPMDHSQRASPAKTVETSAVPKEDWAFAGYDSPDAALQTTVWAWSKREPEMVRACLTPEGQKRLEEALKNMPERARLEASAGYHCQKAVISEKEVAFEMQLDEPLLGKFYKITTKKVNGEWKSEW